MIPACWIAMMVVLAAQASAVTCGDIGDPAERLACYDSIADCAAVADPQERLDCYDAKLASLSPPRSLPAAEGPTALDQGDDEPFPLQGKPRRDQEPVRLVARVVEVTRDQRGRSQLTLDNGQVWRELSDGRFGFEVGTEVELRRGVLGSVNLYAVGREGYVKVRRVE